MIEEFNILSIVNNFYISGSLVWVKWLSDSDLPILEDHQLLFEVDDSIILKSPIDPQQGEVWILISHNINNLKISVRLDPCNVDLNSFESANRQNAVLVRHSELDG